MIQGLRLELKVYQSRLNMYPIAFNLANDI